MAEKLQKDKKCSSLSVRAVDMQEKKVKLHEKLNPLSTCELEVTNPVSNTLQTMFLEFIIGLNAYHMQHHKYFFKKSSFTFVLLLRPALEFWGGGLIKTDSLL